MSDNIDIFQNGAAWVRADFHLHTKADKEFKYSGNDDNFCRLYVEQLKKQGIRIGVISNHNKFDSREFKELKKEALNNGIWLLPGVEFSLKDGFHIIIVFEETWYKNQSDDDNYVKNFLTAAFLGIENPSSRPYPNSKFDLGETVKELDEFKHDYFIILAHVDADNGLFRELKGRTLEAFIQQKAFEKVLAVQKSRDKTNYERLCRESGRQIACVESSDNAVAGIEGLGGGEGKVYLKIGDFNFDAVKYALMNPEYRVKKEPPAVTSSYIKSISFEGGLLRGVKIDFSSGLNNLIGIRGSGKSAVLELLRYALDIPLGDQAVDREYKEGLIKYVLGSGGKVTVEIFNKRGELYRIERIYGQKADIYKNENSSFNLQNSITLDAAFEQRPVYFGQKDLSNKSTDFEGDLIRKIIGSGLNDVREEIENKKREIQRIISELKRLKNLSELRKETEIKRDNAAHKLKTFEEKGIAGRLKRQTSFETDIIKVKDFKENVDSYVAELKILIDNNEFLINGDILPFSDEGKQFLGEMNEQIEELKREFSDLRVILGRSQAVSSNLKGILSRLVYEQNKLKEEFAEIKREIDTANLNSDDYIEIKKEFEISRLKLIEIDKSETARKELVSKLDTTLWQLDGLWQKEFKIFEKEVQRINIKAPKLSIEIKYKARKDKFLSKLKDDFKGSRIRTAVFKRISNEYADFIDIQKDNFQRFKDIITNEEQQSYFKKYFERHLYNLLTFRVDDEITINFDGKPLKDHSLGQRTSALILFLLTQEENVLIIDQPEDDLDNQTIYKDVIREIKKLKGTMQFIFATHNANIPVLGDSEMIIACEYAADKRIKTETGSIDSHSIQEKIIKIMEGGKEAFDIRKKIYEVWDKGDIK